MPSSFFGMDIASTALSAAQTLMDIAGQNIANDATPGYSQQVANLVATQPYAQPDMGGLYTPQLGTGVEVQSVNRVRANYLDGLYRTTQSDESYYSTRTNYLQALQSVLNEPGSNGLSASINTFFSDYQTLSQDPQSSAARTVVQQDGEALAAQIQQIYQGLQNVGQQAQSQASQDVATANSDLQQLANLNQTIAQAQALGQQPNNLLDQRDNLLDSLSKLVNISFTKVTQTVGSYVTSQVQVTLNPDPATGTSAVTLVSGDQYGSLQLSPTATSAAVSSGWTSPAAETDTINGVSVQIHAGDSLSQVASEINAANAGVTAQVVPNGTQDQLALVSTSGQSITGSGSVLFGTTAQGLAIDLGTSQSTLQATDVSGTSATVSAPWTTEPQQNLQGSIGAALHLVNFDLNPSPSSGQSLMQEFTQAVTSLTSAVNAQQEAGYYLDSATGQWTLGQAFFTPSSGTVLTPANIEVNPAIQQDASLIAAGGVQTLTSQTTVADPTSTVLSSGGQSATINGQTVTFSGPVTLDSIISAINGTANVGVTASAVQTSSGQYALALQPTSGAAIQGSGTFLFGTASQGLGIALSAPGNGQNATAMADIAQQQNGPVASYASFVSDMGAAVDLSQNLQGTSKSLLTQVTSQREQTAGVSINEQMTNLIEAQSMYTAAAKVAEAMDSSFQSLLSAIQP